MTDAVRFTIEDGVAELRFDRPDRLNTVDVEMAEAFAAAVERAVADPDVRAILLSGAGRAFMAGGDLASFRAAVARAAVARAIIGPMHAGLRRLADAPQVSIAAVHGAVAGAGMSLALGADLCIAAEGTVLNLAYLKVAAPADCGATWALPRLVGLRRAMEIALLSDDIGSEEALALGLINRVVPADALAGESLRLARRLAAGPGVAQGRLKALLRASLSTPLPEQLDAEEEAFAACAGTEDFGEALEAFFGRRRPDFVGR